MDKIELLTPEDVQKLFGIAPETLRNWRLGKKIKYHKIGHTIRFTKEDIEETLKKYEMGIPTVLTKG